LLPRCRGPARRGRRLGSAFFLTKDLLQRGKRTATLSRERALERPWARMSAGSRPFDFGLAVSGIALGGAISGEHGLGTEKAGYFLELEDPAKIALMRRIKAAKRAPTGQFVRSSCHGPGGLGHPGILICAPSARVGPLRIRAICVAWLGLLPAERCWPRD